MRWEHRVVRIDVTSVFGCLFNSIHFLLAALLVERTDDDRLTEADVAGAA